MSEPAHSRQSESGNVIYFILLGVVLLGLVTIAVQSGGDKGANIDREQLSLRIKQVREQSQDLERGLMFIMQNGISETDIRFAHPDAPGNYGSIDDDPGDPPQYTFQMFHRLGGGVEYRQPPPGITNSSVNWEFFGHSALPDVGTDAADLIAVIPDVTDEFCTKINETNGFAAGVQPEDTGSGADNCLNGGGGKRFSDSNLYADPPNTVDVVSFSSVRPSMEGCVLCEGGEKVFFHVLLAR